MLTDKLEQSGLSRGDTVLVHSDATAIRDLSGLKWSEALTLLKESYLNHLGKLAFKHIYWHVLLPALPLPMVGSRMSTLGKQKHYLNER